MHLNKIGKFASVLFGTIFLISITSSYLFNRFLEKLPSELKATVMIGSYILFSVGFSLIFVNAEKTKRKKAIKIISVITGSLFTIGWFFKFMHWPGAGILIVASSFLFSFGCLPLIIKARYEKRKTILSSALVILSIADLFSVLSILMGLLFKVLHWPWANNLVVVGALFLGVTFIFWNLSFRKEVGLRLAAENKLKETIEKVEQQKKEIEEKQKEIVDSIYYAKRIQTSMMAPEKLIHKKLLKLKSNKAI